MFRFLLLTITAMSSAGFRSTYLSANNQALFFSSNLSIFCLSPYCLFSQCYQLVFLINYITVLLLIYNVLCIITQGISSFKPIKLHPNLTLIDYSLSYVSIVFSAIQMQISLQYLAWLSLYKLSIFGNNFIKMMVTVRISFICQIVFFIFYKF